MYVVLRGYDPGDGEGGEGWTMSACDLLLGATILPTIR
jgi:hypothetical protein